MTLIHFLNAYTDILFPMTTRDVLRCLEQVVSEWFRLGLELGVAESALSTIEYDHHGDVATCKRKMVQEWLRQPWPSWCSLVDALNNTGLMAAASQISQNKGEGEYKEDVHHSVVGNTVHIEMIKPWLVSPTNQIAVFTRYIEYEHAQKASCCYGFILSGLNPHSLL